jgi:YidC/Oxa1 family membrane protein insertase
MSLALFAAEDGGGDKKFWILDPLYAALGNLLAWFYAVIPSYGVAIILLTVAVSILRMPLVAKQVKSQQEMQRIQPELKRIQAKYKTEPQKRNEELMKLYKEHNVNPFAGCLPVLLQMPIFIVLYRLIMDLGRPEPKHIPRSSELFGSLSEAGGKMRSFGMDLAESASSVKGATKLLPYLVLIALVVGTGLFQARQMTARMPKEGMNAQMAIMSKIFPLFLGFFSFSMPGGVVLYFIISNVWQIGQQAFLFRHKPVGADASGGTVTTKVTDGSKKGGGGSAAGSASGAPAAPAKKGLLARLAEAASTVPADKAGGDRKVAGDRKPRPGPAAAKGGGGGVSGGAPAAKSGSGGAGGKGSASSKGARSGNAKSDARRGGSRNGKAGGDRSSPNGRSGESRAGGRTTPKGQAGHRAKPRNSRKGK